MKKYDIVSDFQKYLDLKRFEANGKKFSPASYHKIRYTSFITCDIIRYNKKGLTEYPIIVEKG